MAATVLLRRRVGPRLPQFLRSALHPASPLLRQSTLGLPLHRSVCRAEAAFDRWECGRDDFVAAFEGIAADIHADVESMGMPESAITWVDEMVQYTLPGGKLNRGVMVHLMLEDIVAGGSGDVQACDALAIHRAHILGWCVELVQAGFLVADDMMDGSVTRRGNPCWYKVPGVGTIAINDALLLLSLVFRLLKRHCGSTPSYTPLLETFNEVIFVTELGQLLDTTGVASTVEDTHKFDFSLYEKIVECKTADYTFYLPVACAMALAEETNAAAYAEARALCHAIGEYFQIQDDYLDCYGDPQVTGKVGTDIEDHKCTWLICTALERADATQAKALREAYVAADSASAQGLAAVATVRQLFDELGVPEEYHAFEQRSLAQLRARISSLEFAPRAPFELVLGKLAGRNK